MTAGRIGGSVGWGVIAVFSTAIAGYAVFQVATSFQYLPPEVKANGFPSSLGLQTHIAVSLVALLIGPFQFLKALRTKLPAVHRWMGRIYIAACVVGGVAGGAIALYSKAGPVAGWGFLSLALLWEISTLMALACAMRKDFVAHERWMIRSFALTLAAVTLRLQLPLIFPLGMGFETPYRVIAWSCWVPNLIVAELWIASRRKPKKPRAPATAPASA